jgi:hypothetical protein
MDLNDEILIAYADGELDAETMRKVASALRSDPAARRRLSLLREADATAAAAFAGPEREAVPDRFRNLLDEGGAPGGGMPHLRFPGRRTLYALAATLALCLFFGAGLMAGTRLNGGDRVAAVWPDAALLGKALEKSPSYATRQNGDTAVTVTASYRDRHNRICREFQATGRGRAVDGVACRSEDGAWPLEVLAALPKTQANEGYSPASGGTASTIDDTLTRLGASRPLDADREAALLRNGWRSP